MFTDAISVYASGQPDNENWSHCDIITCTSELNRLVRQWWYVDSSQDGFFSGVLADWIEDHPEQMQEEPEVIARLLSFLRHRTTNPDCNVIIP